MLKLAALVVVVLLNASSAVAATTACHNISGGYVQEFVPCNVPAVACVDATLTGDLVGVSHTVITTFDPTTQAFTGDVTIVRNNGSILTATIKGVSGSGVGFETITGGTRQFVGATGFIVATDIVHFVGNYAGQYCLAGDEQ